VVAVNTQMWHRAKVLIVDDQETNIRLLERLLADRGFKNVRSTTDPRQVVPMCEELEPDVILLDLHMGGMDGFEVLRAIRPATNGSFVPVLVLTADITQEAKKRALAMGAKDFVTKPFDLLEVGLRIENLVETRFLHQRLREHNTQLEEDVAKRTHDLEEARFEIVERLAKATEYRDDDTHQHTQRVGQSSRLLAAALGLPDRLVELMGRAAPLHDVGKIGIPDAVLLKRTKLTAREFDLIKTHTSIGSAILSGSSFPLLQMAEEIASTHHERWDGTGYGGLAGEAIPQSGRIVAVADAFDAMTHDRPYRKAGSVTDAVAEIQRMSGTQFDPRVAEAFRTLEPQDLV
jgi:putative two-component system response regulator